MPVIEKEREKLRGAQPKKAVREPKKYRAVYTQDSTVICGCNIQLLCSVFNKSAPDAIAHLQQAVNKGEATLLIGPRDLIETKTSAGNRAAHDPRACSLLQLSFFRCEPL